MHLFNLRFIFLPILFSLLFYSSNSQLTHHLLSENKTQQMPIQNGVQSTEPLSPEEALKRFKLPEGFKIELYASEPVIGKPMNIAFDVNGKLWVTESQEYPFAATSGEGKDRIVILEDRDKDGKAETRTVFSDTLNIPIGILPYQSGVIAFSIPNIYQFNQNKGKPKVLVGPFGHKDTHGMINNLMRGYDGWVYVCHGFSNTSNPVGTDGSKLSMSSGNTFRFKTDGSKLEQTTYGRVNPFGQTLDEWGYLYSIDCHTSPLYQLIEGGDYPHFGKVETGIGFAPFMKPQGTEATAISGIAYYSDNVFPKAYQSNFFVGDVVKSRLYRYTSTFNGSSPVAKLEEDFLSTDDPWFRPVDVKLGPDGAIYVADFYNRIIGHYEVPLDHPGRDRMRGRIWRISYEGNKNGKQAKTQIDWTKASFSKLMDGLNTPNLELRMHLINELSDRVGTAAINPLKKSFSKDKLTVSQYVSGLWVLFRLNALDESLIANAFAHTDPIVRTHVLRILNADNTSKFDLAKYANLGLKDPVVHVQRVGVQILGSIKQEASVHSLLNFSAVMAKVDDHLHYEVRLALRELLKNEKIAKFVNAQKWDQRNMDFIAKSYLGVDTPYAAYYLNQVIQNGNIIEAQLMKYVSHAARFLPHNELNSFVEFIEKTSMREPVKAMGLYQSVVGGLDQRGYSKEIVKTWGQDLAGLLLRNQSKYLEKNPELLVSAWNLAAVYKLKEWASLGVETFNETNHANLKAATGAYLLATSNRAGVKSIFDRIKSKETPIPERKKLLELVGGNMSAITLHEMDVFMPIDPEIQVDVLSALSGNKEGKSLILQKIKRGQIDAKNLVNPSVNERILINMTPEQKMEHEYLVKSIGSADTEKQALLTQRLEAFKEVPVLTEGKAVFKTYCAPCHQVAEGGSTIGPQLSSVGTWGKGAIAEKILDPNRNISSAFRMYTIRTKDGKIHSGLFRRDLGDVIFYADANGQEFSIRKDDVVERQISNYTLMPNHFGTVLSQNDFNGLLSYLLTLK